MSRTNLKNRWQVCLYSGIIWGGDAWDDTIKGAGTRMKKNLWLSLERTLEKQRRKVGAVTRRQLKWSSLRRGR